MNRRMRPEELVPPELYYPLHLNLIAHGRAICQARRPRCEVCPLKAECEYYQETQRRIVDAV